MKTVIAVGMGVLLALLLAILVVVGILAPVLSAVFGLEADRSRAIPVILPLLLFVTAFSFYFGGMAAAYKAPGRRLLHGIAVAPVAFVLSAGLNLVSGKGLLPGLDSGWSVGLAVAFLLVAVGSSYVGGRRGEALFAHNRLISLRRRRQRAGQQGR